MLVNLDTKKIWFITGSQHLYGEETLKQVKEHSAEIVKGFNNSGKVVVEILDKGLATTPAEVTKLLSDANNDPQCIGVVAWMHTFSPAKMWINGLTQYKKPLCHLHTQFNAEIPWDSIDMDFMNLNQSAHGDREFGHMVTRLRIKRKVIAGHWKSEKVQEKLGVWSRVALGWDDWQGAKFARIGDNMREVAVTEGDKVEAQVRFGFSVNGYDSSDIVNEIKALEPAKVEALVKEYESSYNLMPSLLEGGEKRESLYEAARIELGLRAFLEKGGFKGYTDTFENLGELRQLPGIASQRLMADGYGFGAEGDWKTAALLRASKVMNIGLEKGTSFMEDYTYHLNPSNPSILGSHMLEVDPVLAVGKPSCEIHPLGIGGKADPVRLVFNSRGNIDSLNAALMDFGNHFRLLINKTRALEITEELPKLPVARVLWKPLPDLYTAAQAWILAGGAHHTCYSENISVEQLEDFAEIAGIESLVIDEDTKIRDFKNTLRWNETYYK